MYNLKEGEIIVLDIEANGLRRPDKVHVICTREQNGKQNEFYLKSQKHKEVFIEYLKKFKTYAGHNIIQFDLMEVLDHHVPGHPLRRDNVLDTLVISRLLKYDIEGGHSIRAWGERFGIIKQGQGIEQWDTLTDEMVLRCHSDCEISMKILDKYMKYLKDPDWLPALMLEHNTAFVCGQMTQDGFPFDMAKAVDMRERLIEMVRPIDEGLDKAFPPLPVFVREITPRITKTGEFNLNDFRWYDGDDLTVFNGGPFSVIRWEPFNPGSPKQIVERLNEAGWKPTDKTKGHIDALKSRTKDPERLEHYRRYGWKVSEENLKTLPDTAPQAAKDLGRRIVLQSRISDLEEWIALAELEGDQYVVHGHFNPIGAWTHRLSHAKPNLANVPVAKRSSKDSEFEALINDFNDEMRGLWRARPGHRLIGTDADGLQMRIFAHYVQDEELINALIKGSKEDKTDIHSLHQRKLGEPCRSRDDAKTFIYAWLLGAGVAKVSEILKCTTSLARGAVESFIASYPKLKELKHTQIPQDASRGFFIGLDGRKVVCSSEHLMLAGYLQNGEAIIMKGACREWQDVLNREKIPYRMATWPHDEWQTEVPDDDDVCRFVQQVQIQSIRNQSSILSMNCPLEGSSDWGYTWKETH